MCRTCDDTGWVWVGTGHRISSGLGAEKTASDTCSCDIGQQINRKHIESVKRGKIRAWIDREYVDDHMSSDPVLKAKWWIVHKWYDNDFPRLDWMTDYHWAAIEMARSEQ